MSEETLTTQLQMLALSYAPESAREGIKALISLDVTLGRILRTTSEPMVGQMRLAWWREALAQLDVTSTPAEPALQAIARDALPLGVSVPALSRMADGWEVLLGEIGDDALTSYSLNRGVILFEQIGTVLGADLRDPLALAGQGWALADLAANVGDARVGDRARSMARDVFAGMEAIRWSKRGRMLGAWALIAKLSLKSEPQPWWIARLAWHRISGR